MESKLVRVLLTILYAVLAIILALPISYFFQDDILQVMSLKDYVLHSPKIFAVAYEYHAFVIYKIVASVLIIIMVILGNLFEKLLFRKKGK